MDIHNTDNILSVLEAMMPPSADDVARKLADDFRQRRIEKGLTREDMTRRSGVALSNIARFEQRGLVSLKNLIELAISLGYLPELHNLFAAPKYSTIEELTQIRRNAGKKKVHHRLRNKNDEKN